MGQGGRRVGVVPTAAVVVVGWAAWRIGIGASYEDDGHAVALALRFARGDRPFVDDQTLLAPASLPMVPFVWAWDRWVGADGLVLATRGFFVVFALGVAAVSYRALRTRWSARASLAGVLVGVLPWTYHLPVLSYSSLPVLVLVLGVAAGFALVASARARWAVLLGVLTVGAAALTPQLAPAYALMGIVPVALTRSRRLVLLATLAATATAVPVAVWLLSEPTRSGLVETLAATLAQRSSDSAERFTRAASSYLTLATRLFLPLWLGVAAALVGLFVRRLGWLTLLGTTLALTWATVVPMLTIIGIRPDLSLGTTASALVSVLTLALGIPVALDTCRRRDRDAGTLLALAAGPSVVGALVVAATTASGPTYSVHGSVLAPLAMAVVCCWAQALPRWIPSRVAEPVGWGVALLPAACLILLISVRPFQEPPVWNLTERVATGPWRGALTTTTRSQDLSTLAALVGRCPGPGHGVLVVGFPGGYLDTTCRFDTNALWVEARDGGTAPTRAWLERTGRRPDLVVISDRIKREAGGELAWATGDPLGAWIAATYEQSERVPGFATAYRPRAG